MKKLIFHLFILLGFTAKGQNEYSVAKIAPELIENASVVIRNEQQVFELKNSSQATYTYKTAVTILNKNGEEASYLSEYYDRFSNITNLRATIYDANGQKIKDYKSSDFKDKSAISDGSIYEDGRMKQLVFLHSTFPYTIEYSYIKDYSGLTSYPSWYPVHTFDYAVEKSDYTFLIPSGMSFKYLKSKHLKTDSTQGKDKITYKWSCENLAALPHEPYSTGLRNVRPWVSLSPNVFEYDKSVGNLENWKNVGAWLYQLNSDPQLLPPVVKTKVASLVAGAKTPKEKVSKLYQYLQSNTRYVSVQLGLGGFKPINADKVANVNYGDCKALSNYMKALLNEANIPSNLVMIGSDMPSLNPNFASLNQANHMILFVPLQKDTVWLECTSQHKPMGYLSYGCSDKNVLIVTAEGGKLLKTPKYEPADNFQLRKINIELNEKGAAEIKISTDYGYAQFENSFSMLLKEPTEQRKDLMNELAIPNMQLLTINYVQPDKSKPILKENITLKSSQLLTGAGDKLFLTLNLLNRKESVPARVTDRKTNFSVPFGYHDEDEISYTLPVGFKVEYLPKDINIISEFGIYTMQTVVKGNTILYKRTQTMHHKQYIPEKYNDLIDFYKKIYQSDKLKSILAKVN